MNNLPIEVVFNQLEALMWLLISLALLIRVLVLKLRQLPIALTLLLLVPTFALFGLSDLIEARTGAWWRPWWLLVLKSLCVAVFFYCFAVYLKSRSQARKISKQHP